MTTLVIHPNDRSTDFLKPIYENIEGDVNVITGGYYKDTVRAFIDQADRIILLGHGSFAGLFSVGQFEGCNGMIIDETMIISLGNKPNNMYIWCNADKFVNRSPLLKGFYSGMFISEYTEALFCNTPTKVGDVEYSNDLFSDIVGKNTMLEAKQLCEVVKTRYYIPGNKVAEYNNQRLYFK